MPQDSVKSIIEALLFSSDKPLTLEQLKSALDHLETSEIRKILEELAGEFESAERGIRIIEIAGGFQMVTASAAAPFLKKLYRQPHTEKLSKPALETLAIIAYKQPVTRLEINAIRNVDSVGVVKNLLEKGVIRVAGRKKAPGRPKVYGTTRQFLEYFGLKSLEELPKVENLPADLVREENKDGAEKITQSN